MTIAESFPLPTALAAGGYSLRDEVAADDAYLLKLYGDVRGPELARVPNWTDAEKAGFVADQFAAQRHHYRTRIEACRFLVIERDGAPIGRLYLQERDRNWQVVDIALEVGQRGQGLGGAIVAHICDLAAAMGKGVGLFVEHDNAAQRLYRRLGFRTVRDAGVYAELAWSPIPESVANPLS